MNKILPILLWLILIYSVSELGFNSSGKELGQPASPSIAKSSLNKKHTKQDRIDLAIAQEVALTQNPATGQIPRERLLAVHHYLERQAQSSTRAAISGISWDERGPNNVAGRTRSLLVDQADPSGNTIWAASVGGGLWKTTNISSNPPTWMVVSDTFNNIAGTALAQDPTNFSTLYFGTGEGWFNSDAIRGLGIWKSVNGGLNWTLLASTNNTTFFYIQKIIVDGSGNIFACTRSDGVHKSTDGGTSWTKVLGSGTFASVDRAADLEIAANGDLFAAMGIFQQDGIYKSTNGGTSWTKLVGGLPTTNYERIELACAPSDANRVYALLQDASTNTCLGIYRTDNGGTNWIAVTNPGAFGMSSFTRGQAWYDLIAMVSPADPDRLFIGGIDILVSDDAGATFTQISQWYGGGGFQYAHADQHAFIFQPGNTNVAYFANDGGLFRSTNANDPTLSNISMTERNSGYNITQYYACAIHPLEGNDYFLAGSQDNGTQRYSGPGINATDEVTGGDGAFCHIDEDEPDIQISSYVYNSYFLSTNGFISESSVEFTDGSGDEIGSFINPTDYDSRSNTLYACAEPGEYLRWEDVTNNTNEEIVPIAAFGGARVTHVNVSPNVNNRVYFGLSNGRVVIVDNAHTNSPVAVHRNLGSGMPGGSISCIAIEDGDEDHILVTYSNYGVTSVWESTNGGLNWSNKEGNLPDMPVRWAIFDPCDSDQALLATEMGVWSTNDLTSGSVDWGINDNNLPRVRTDMIKIRRTDGKLIIATHGRGLYSTDYFVKPTIRFTSAETTLQESGADGTEGLCKGYREFDLTIEITAAPANDVTVLIANGPNNTATGAGADYQLMTPTSMVFAAGLTTSKTVTVRIYDDGELEGTELLELEINTLNNCDAYIGTQNTHSFNIEEAETTPAGGMVSTVLLLDENFDAGVQPAGWSTSTLGSGAGFGFGNAASLSAPYWPITDNGTNIAGMNDNGNPNSANDRLIAPIIDLSTATSATVYFDAFFGRYSFGGFTENAFLEISTNGGASWDQYQISGYGNNWTTLSLNLGAYLTESAVSIVFRYNDNGGYLYGMAIDNVLLEADITSAPAAIESVLNKEDTHEFGPFETIHFFDIDGEIIATLQNISAHDFGCTTAKIDRSGSNAISFWENANTARDLASKTLLITPEINDPTASISITMYYSASEVAGWELASGNTWGANAKIVKSPGPIDNVNPTNPYPDGTDIQQAVDASGNLGAGADYYISGTFNNGLSGFGVGDPGPPPTFDVSLLDFRAELYPDGKVELLWTTAREEDNQGFAVERSTDGERFSTLVEVAGQGNSNELTHYQSWDDEPSPGQNLYRLRQIDLDGSTTLSKIVEVKLLSEEGLRSLKVYPNQFTDFVELHSSVSLEGPLKIEWLSLDGKLLDRQIWKPDLQQQSIRISTQSLNLAVGIYILRITTPQGEKKSFKLKKQP